MDRDVITAFAKIDASLEGLSNSAQTQIEQIQAINDRLDQLIRFLTQKPDPDKPDLGDLLSEIINIGHRQLAIAQQTIQEIAKLSRQPPDGTGHSGPVHEGRAG